MKNNIDSIYTSNSNEFANAYIEYLVKILISHFKNIGVEYFHVHIDEDNKYSLNIFEKLGFKIKKTLMNSENKQFNLLTLFVK